MEAYTLRVKDRLHRALDRVLARVRDRRARDAATPAIRWKPGMGPVNPNRPYEPHARPVDWTSDLTKSHIAKKKANRLAAMQHEGHEIREGEAPFGKRDPKKKGQWKVYQQGGQFPLSKKLNWGKAVAEMQDIVRQIKAAAKDVRPCLIHRMDPRDPHSVCKRCGMHNDWTLQQKRDFYESDGKKVPQDHIHPAKDGRPRLHRALDRCIEDYRLKRVLDAIGEDVTPEILAKLKAMEGSARKLGNIGEADAFLSKVHQYDPTYVAGSGETPTEYGPGYQRAQQRQQGGFGGANWEDIFRRAAQQQRQDPRWGGGGEAQRRAEQARHAGRQSYSDFQEEMRRHAEQVQRDRQTRERMRQQREQASAQRAEKKKAAPSAGAKSTPSGTSAGAGPAAGASGGANWRSAAAKKAWETMRAKKAAKSGGGGAKDDCGCTKDFRARLHRALDQQIDRDRLRQVAG